jgi:hypothetical protein
MSEAVDSYEKRVVCQDDYISPPWADEEILYTEIVSTGSASENILL